MFSNLPKLDDLPLPRRSHLSFEVGDRVVQRGLFLTFEGEVVRILSRKRRLYRVKWDRGRVETVKGELLTRD